VAGRHAGFVVHYVFMDEGQELPLLAGGAARERGDGRFGGGDGL
jgi:hypothetical protein